MLVMPDFWDRQQDLGRLKSFLGKGAFAYVTGRRRVGKTALLVKACDDFGGLYHQAVEGTAQQQIEHLVEEWKARLPIFSDLTPKTWSEFFPLLSRENLPPLLVFDEFPYWVQGDPTLPSILQKWVDHELPKKKTAVYVSGSSQSMLHAQFLNQSSPLYGRTLLHLHLAPLSFSWFCRALKYPLGDPVSFERYTLVGGIPHYWKLIPEGLLLKQVEDLYFEPSAPLAEEPHLMIQDEGLTGALPKAIMDLVGRGVSKPSEVAGRLGTVQGNLSRPLALLQDLGFISRELPFGESVRTTKRVLYSIPDPPLSFYYRTYLPFRGRWKTLNKKEKGEIMNLHFSRQWEIFCRAAYPDAGRYWEGETEIDLVAPLPSAGNYLVGECKWSDLSKAQEESLEKDLRERFSRTKLSHKLKKVEFQIFSQKDLPSLGTT